MVVDHNLKRNRENDDENWNHVSYDKCPLNRINKIQLLMVTAHILLLGPARHPAPLQKRKKYPPFLSRHYKIGQIWSHISSAKHQLLDLKWKKKIKINVDSELEYRKLQQIFQQESLYYRRFLQKKKTNQKFVIAGRPENRKMEQIEDLIYVEELEIISIHQLFRGSTTNKILHGTEDQIGRPC